MAASDVMGPKGAGAGIGDDRTPVGDIGDEAASVIELSGVIKWFDVSKGYGFIVPDNGLPDVLLHVTCLRRDGYQVAYEGARVVVEVLQRARGLQAFRVISMDETTAVHPTQLPPARWRAITRGRSARVVDVVAAVVYFATCRPTVTGQIRVIRGRVRRAADHELRSRRHRAGR